VRTQVTGTLEVPVTLQTVRDGFVYSPTAHHPASQTGTSLETTPV
jgi:hypothetical protein